MDITEQWGKIVRNRVSRKLPGTPPETRQDYEQDCYVKLLELQDTIERIHADQGIQSATKFVYKVLNQYIIDLKKYNGRRDHEPLSEFYDTPAPKANNTVDSLAIDQAIENLSPAEQYVVRGYYFLGKREKELAAETGKSLRWVQGVKARAISELKLTLGN